MAGQTASAWSLEFLTPSRNQESCSSEDEFQQASDICRGGMGGGGSSHAGVLAELRVVLYAGGVVGGADDRGIAQRNSDPGGSTDDPYGIRFLCAPPEEPSIQTGRGE